MSTCPGSCLANEPGQPTTALPVPPKARDDQPVSSPEGRRYSSRRLSVPLVPPRVFAPRAGTALYATRIGFVAVSTRPQEPFEPHRRDLIMPANRREHVNGPRASTSVGDVDVSELGSGDEREAAFPCERALELGVSAAPTPGVSVPIRVVLGQAGRGYDRLWLRIGR